MVKKCSWITGFAIVLAVVLAVGVFCAPKAAAAEINYGSANLPSGVQEQIDAAAQLRANATALINASTCPLCNTAVTWTKATGNISVSGGKHGHYYIEGSLELNSNGWPIEVYGTNSKLHIILKDADVKLLGSIWVGDANAKNVELAIMGNGSITSNGSKGSSASPKGNGLFWMRGDSPTLILDGGTYTYTYASQNNETALINTYAVTGTARVDMYDGTVIGPETMSTTVDAYNVHLTNTVMNMYGGTIRNGTRVVNTWGGGANVSIKGNSTLNMYGGTIQNSYSKYAGSNINLTTDTSVLNMYGGTVSGGQFAADYATGYGANIYTAKTEAKIQILGGKVTGGSGAVYGGNIASLGADVTIGGTALIENGAVSTKLDSAGKLSTSGQGGNIFANGGAIVTISGGKIAGGKITGSASDSTTGVYSDYGYGGNISLSSAVLKMSGGVIEGGSSPNGGSVYVAGSTSDATISGGEISGARAKWGGGLYVAAGKLTISGGTISDASAGFRGGNIYIEGSTTANITGGTIADGYIDASVTALDRTGANIHFSGTGKLTISGGTISGGQAAQGGSISLINGTTEITGTAKIKDGYALLRGGNILLRGGAVLSITGGRIAGGVSTEGGNLYAQEGALSISGGVITGGQVYCDDEANFDANGNIIVWGSKYKGGNIFATMDVNISGGTISAGESQTSWGGNIFIQNHTLNVTGGVITDGKAANKSDGRGGNIAGLNAVINISGSAAVQNGKAHEGGNVYIDEGTCALNISGGKVSGGKADKGGNVYAAQKQPVVITGGEISGGVAELGGNVYIGYNGKLQQTAGTISGGSCVEAGTNGGDIDFDDLQGVGTKAAPQTKGDAKANGTNVYLYRADYIMQGGTIAAVAGQEIPAVFADCARVYLLGQATVTNGNIEIVDSGKLFVNNSWSGSASVVFPEEYSAGMQIDGNWAENGEVTVNDDLTVSFVAGGTMGEGMLQHGSGANDAILSTGSNGSLILGVTEYVAMIGSNIYKTLNQALNASKEGDMIVLGENCTLDGDLFLKKGRTLNLNGRVLTVNGEVTAANKTAHIIDTTNGAGALLVVKEKCALNRSNSYLPVWVKGEGYHFVKHQIGTNHRTAQTHPDKDIPENAVQFLFWMDGSKNCFLAQQLADGGADNGIEVKIKMSWINAMGVYCEQYFTFPEKNIMDYTKLWETGSVYLTVKNAMSVQDLQFTAMLVCDDAVEMTSAAYPISFN